MALPQMKLVVVGDGGCGKTSLLINFTEGGRFPTDYVPTVFDNIKYQQDVDGRNVSFDLYDTAGQESYARLRQLSYPGSDVFLLCYSIGSKVSLNNVKAAWWPEVTHHNPTAQLVLVGTKSDLRGEEEYDQGKIVTDEEVKEIADHIEVAASVQCSAKAGEGVLDVFRAAANAVFGAPPPKKKKKGCSLL